MGKSSWTLLLLTVFACGNESPKPAPRKPAEVKKPVDKSAWKEIETPVPVGKKLACAALFPADKLATATGRKLDIVDESSRDPGATSLCRFINVDKKGKHGDELCMVTLNCWQQFTVADIHKKCDEKGGAGSTDLGAFTCVETLRAGDKQRHVITVLEPDTRCRVVVNAGFYVYDVDTTRGCAKAVVDLFDASSLKL